MISVKPLMIEDHSFVATSVQLPKTNLLIISNEIGYVMCGALDVDLLNEKLSDRKIIAARATGVKTIEQLLEAPLDKVTIEAKNKGWYKGITTKDALLKIAE
ncbi:YunC family protein [Aquibacillus saliphilus]|uniref:YunC family protein n=1 Tax=Aquibacillus saliphilus TaxID=1909422 RepID=UPI001CEFD1F7|nr:DUF1805 domain-containing protein [Aquibacillus saliphilus]